MRRTYKRDRIGRFASSGSSKRAGDLRPGDRLPTTSAGLASGKPHIVESVTPEPKRGTVKVVVNPSGGGPRHAFRTKPDTPQAIESSRQKAHKAQTRQTRKRRK